MTRLERLEAQQARLRQASRLRWVHWSIIGLSIVAMLTLWQAYRFSTEQRLAQRFDRQADQVVELFRAQLERYTDIVRASAGFVAGTETISPTDWHRFTDSLDLGTEFPALTSLGLAYQVGSDELAHFIEQQRLLRPDYTVRPDHGHDTHLPMVHVSPRALEYSLPGFDVAQDADHRDAAERAITLRSAQITSAVKLPAGGKPGVVMFLPFYKTSALPMMPFDNREHAGVVVASILLDPLASGVLDRDSRQVWVAISNNGKKLYDEHNATHVNLDPEPLFMRSKTVEFYGREWTFDIQTTLAFRNDTLGLKPLVILAIGLTIEALLISMLLLLTRGNRKTLQFSERVREAMHEKSAALEESYKALESRNEELKAFSYMVSHDLKTPLRGIQWLQECLVEDLEPYLEDQPETEEVERNLKRINQQVHRANSLITGILEYSRLGSDDEQATTFDTAEQIGKIGEMLGVGTDKLHYRADLPVFETYETRLSQVLTNLIGNAFKYHDNAENAIVTVDVDEQAADGFYRFSVSDNGPGIDPQHHERIFEVFKTLQPKDAIESTGVGLSIVKKNVEQFGGEVTVESRPGNGTRFIFFWPRFPAPDPAGAGEAGVNADDADDNGTRAA